MLRPFLQNSDLKPDGFPWASLPAKEIEQKPFDSSRDEEFSFFPLIRLDPSLTTNPHPGCGGRLDSMFFSYPPFSRSPEDDSVSLSRFHLDHKPPRRDSKNEAAWNNLPGRSRIHANNPEARTYFPVLQAPGPNGSWDQG